MTALHSGIGIGDVEKNATNINAHVYHMTLCHCCSIFTATVLLNVKQPTAARQNVMMSDWTDGKDALRSEQRKKELRTKNSDIVVDPPDLSVTARKKQA